MRVTVGRVGKPHGIRGEVTVEPRTDEPDSRFAPGEQLFRESGSDLVVSAMHWHSGKLLVKFLGVDTRNAAEELRGSIVQVERDELEIPQDPDEFYDSNLLGCAVVMLNGEAIGSVTDVLHLPAQDVLVVTSGEREILIPFVEDIVPQIDIAAQQIVVDPPPGLLTDE